jgi:hypothetical protein
VFAAVAGVAVWFVYQHRDWLGLGGSNQPTEAANSDLQPARVAWRPVERAQDGFTIDMPAETTEIRIPAYDAKGGAEQMNMLVSMPNADTTYAIAWDDNPPVERANGESVEQTLDKARDGALARTRTMLIGESKASYMGYPARNFSARNDNGGLFDARLVLAGNRLYMMIVSFPAESARLKQDVNHFFDSFKTTGTVDR